MWCLRIFPIQTGHVGIMNRSFFREYHVIHVLSVYEEPLRIPFWTTRIAKVRIDGKETEICCGDYKFYTPAGVLD